METATYPTIDVYALARLSLEQQRDYLSVYKEYKYLKYNNHCLHEKYKYLKHKNHCLHEKYKYLKHKNHNSEVAYMLLCCPFLIMSAVVACLLPDLIYKWFGYEEQFILSH